MTDAYRLSRILAAATAFTCSLVIIRFLTLGILGDYFTTLRFLVFEATVSGLLAALTYVIFDTREIRTPSQTRRARTKPLLYAAFGVLCLAWVSLWNSFWYPQLWYFLAIGGVTASISWLALTRLDETSSGSEWVLGVILMLAITIKTATYLVNMYPWVGDGAAHLVWSESIVQTGYNNPNIGAYFYYYPGYQIWNAMLIEVSSMPESLFPIPSFVVLATVAVLVSYLIGMKLGGNVLAILTSLIVAVTLMVDISWQPSITAILYGAAAFYILARLGNDAGGTSRSLVICLWLMFFAALLTYPVAALAVVLASAVDAARKARAGRISTFLVGSSATLVSYLIYVSSGLFTTIIQSIFLISPSKFQPIVVTLSSDLTWQYLAQYTLNFLPFTGLILFAAFAAFHLIGNHPRRRISYTILGVPAALTFLLGLQFFSGITITNLTEINYLFLFISPLAAFGVALVRRVSKSVVVTLAIIMLIFSITLVGSISNSPSLLLLKDSTGFSPIYGSLGTLEFGYLVPDFPGNSTIYADGSTSAYDFSGAGYTSWLTSGYIPLQNSSYVGPMYSVHRLVLGGTCHNCYVIVNIPELERFSSTPQDVLIGPTIQGNDANPTSSRIMTSYEMVVYLER